MTRLHGTAVFLGIIMLEIPPFILIPRESGVTSRRSKSRTSTEHVPESIEACIAAPTATASSGLIDLLSCLPLKKLERPVWMKGILVEPPTSTMSSTCSFVMPASSRTCCISGRHFSKSGWQSYSNLLRDISTSRSSSGAKFSQLTFMFWANESSRFAFSHAVRRRVIARALVFLISTPDVYFLNSAMQYSISTLSKSFPPKCVSPFVAFTSSKPLSMFNSVTSNVPPPRSKMSTFTPFTFYLLSNPYAIAAAVGSLMIRCTCRPAIVPASFVACL